jgi:hypothetical protein
MDWQGLTVKLQLAYPPVSNFDFTNVRGEPAVQQWLHDSMIYMIVQRPVLTFDNVVAWEGFLTFDIVQRGNDQKLHCHMPVRQRAFGNDPDDDIDLEMGWHDEVDEKTMLACANIDAFKFYCNQEFSAWLTPERFLYEWQHGHIQAEVAGNPRTFVAYHVHYVGKATDQPIWDRLDGHKTLQKILSIVRPTVGSLPTHELALLLFRVEEAWSVKIFEPESLFEAGPALPSKKEISLDAEKLLVKSLAPGFNDPKKSFPNYPISKDGLYSYDFNRYAYQITDELALSNGSLVIQGALDQNKADILAIDNNETVTVMELFDWS